MPYLAVIGCFVLVYLLTPLVRRLALSVGAVDRPDARKVHREPVARLGGLAIYVAFVIFALLALPLDREVGGLLAGGTLVFGLGVVDDLRGLSPRLKLAGQVVAALVLVWFGVRVDFVTNPLDGMIFLGDLAWPVTVLWVVGVTNALNLVDGLDGLAAGTAAIAGSTMAVVAYLQGETVAALAALLLVAGTLAFLRYNFHPARLFMGDSGSMFLGFNLAALAIMGTAKSATVISLFIPVVILGLPILDTFWAIFRRYRSRRPIFAPDKQHIHHRLLGLGFSQRQTVLLIYGINISLGLSAILLTMLTTAQSVLMLLGVAVAALVLINLVDYPRAAEGPREDPRAGGERRPSLGQPHKLRG